MRSGSSTADSDDAAGFPAPPDSLTLSIIGTRSGTPRAGEPASGYVLRAGRTTMLFDCGPGVAGALFGVVAPASLDAVFLSHLHADHCYDILPVGKAIVAPYVTYPQADIAAELRTTPERIPLYVPTGSTENLRTLQGLFPVVSSPPLDQALDLAFDLREYAPYDHMEIGDCVVTASPARHVVPTCGFRVESPAGTFAYTSDTGWTDSLIELAKDADLLLCEATLRETDSGPHGHLSAREAGKLAAAAQVGILVLTHFSNTDADWLDALHNDAADEFSGTVHIARPGLVFKPHTGEESRR